MADVDIAKLAAGGVAAALFGIYADLAYNTYSATNSSPQTTELFATDRSETLWKYVKLGDLQVVALGVFGSMLAKSLWPIVGSAAVVVVMHLLYRHALESGLANRKEFG